ncbi:MAG: hypothetical protein ACPGVA_14310 [Pikeienuella sp.]
MKRLMGVIAVLFSAANAQSGDQSNHQSHNQNAAPPPLFCSQLHNAISTQIVTPVKAPLDLTSIPPFHAGSRCGTSKLITGERASHCMVAHPLRDATALSTFSGLKEAMSNCPHVAGRIPNTASVNHPDSYQQHSYIFRTVGGNWRVDISLKDKSSLSASLITLQVSRAAED